MLFNIVMVIHVILAVLMIAVILVQHGKGAEAGATFGGGGASTVFGASGAANFMTRLTAILTALFFTTSISLVVLSKKQQNAMTTLPSSGQTVPVAPTAPNNKLP